MNVVIPCWQPMCSDSESIIIATRFLTFVAFCNSEVRAISPCEYLVLLTFVTEDISLAIAKFRKG